MDTTPPDPAQSEDDVEAPSPAFADALRAYEGAAPQAAQATRAAKPLAPGAKVKGKVVTVAADHALVDIGARSEAVADLANFRNDDGTLRIAAGDAVELFVLEVGDQITLAPSVKADARAGLDRMRAARAAGMPVEGRVTGVNTGGLEVDLGGIRAFCPVSHIEAGFCSEPASYVGRTLEFLVTQVDESRRNVVLSRRELLRRASVEEGKRKLAALKPGDEVEGTVRRLEAFGAFVDLGGIDGMVHVSEIQHGHLTHPREALSEGQKVRAKVLRIEPGKDGRTKIALSIKAVGPDPWAEVGAQFKPGQRVTGTVARIAEFGAFVTLAPGVDGLVHVSELAPHRVERVKDVVTVGQEIQAIVQSVEPEKRRVSLSIKAVLAADSPHEEASPPPQPRRSAQAMRAHAPRPQAPRPAPRTPAPPRPAAPVQPEGPRELTTMAIALREAAERARKKLEQQNNKS